MLEGEIHWYSTQKDFRDILLKQVTAPEEYKSGMTDEEKILLKQHDLGFTELMLSMKDDRLMMMVSNSTGLEIRKESAGKYFLLY